MSNEEEPIDPLLIKVERRIKRIGHILWEEFCHLLQNKRHINTNEIRQFHYLLGIRYDDLLLFLIACGCDFDMEELRCVIDHEEERDKGCIQCQTKNQI